MGQNWPHPSGPYFGTRWSASLIDGQTVPAIPSAVLVGAHRSKTVKFRGGLLVSGSVVLYSLKLNYKLEK
jgi:hypothetical protein